MKMNIIPLLSATAVLALVQPAGAQQGGAFHQNRNAYQKQQDTPGQSTEKTAPGAVTRPSEKANLPGAFQVQKASDLVGKQVRNAQDEKLGTIKDLALDLKTGKIAYAVLSTGGGVFGIGGKYIAVPAALISESAGKDFVMLNASKEQIDSMPGFDRNNWPNMPSSAWGAPNKRLESPYQAHPTQPGLEHKYHPGQSGQNPSTPRSPTIPPEK